MGEVSMLESQKTLTAMDGVNMLEPQKRLTAMEEVSMLESLKRLTASGEMILRGYMGEQLGRLLRLATRWSQLSQAPAVQ